MPQSPFASEYFTEKASDYLRGWFRKVVAREDPGIQEEQNRIIAKAAKYDTLGAGWMELLEFMMQRVNQEIADATSNPMNPEEQRLHVIRWNAMRELLDAGISELEDTRRERDRIMEHRREDERDGN